MPYVTRDATGRITGLYPHRTANATEWLDPTEPEVVDVYLSGKSVSEVKSLLATTDADLVRIVEDLIETLITKNVFQFTDLPRASQEKLMRRKQLRSRLREGKSFIVDNDEIL